MAATGLAAALTRGGSTPRDRRGCKIGVARANSPRRAVDGPTQFLHQTSLTAEEYLTRQEWWRATPPPCPYHAHGGCQLRPHGSYARVVPKGLRVRRFVCPDSGRTVSLLPVFLAARLTGTLQEVEATVQAVEEAAEQPVRWRELHPLPYYSGRARRWVLRRVAGVRRLLQLLGTLYPERCGGLEPTLAGFAAREGVAAGEGQLLARLRTVAQQQLAALPAPVGFRPWRPSSADKAGAGAGQHETARSPPPGRGAGLAD